MMESRREFIKKSALAGAGLPLMGTSLLNEPLKNANKVGGKSGNIPIFAFSKHFQFLEDFGELSDAMLEAGIDGIDLTVRPGGHVEPAEVEEALPRAVEAMKKQGLMAPMIVTKIDDPENPITLRLLKTASQEGVQYYRMAYYSYDDQLGIEKSIAKYKPLFKGLSELNEQYKIHGAYQNHSGDRVGSAVWDLRQLLDGLNPDWIGCQYDIRHGMAEGANSWPLGLKLLKPWVRCVDVKDYRWEKVNGQWKALHVPLGEGMVDLTKFFGYLKEFGFEGPISLHIEYSMFDDKDKSLSLAQKRKIAVGYLKHDMDYLKEKLSESELG